MSDLSRTVHNDHTGLLAALIALFRQFAIMQLNGGHPPSDTAQFIADANALHDDAQAHLASVRAQQAAVQPSEQV